MAKKKEVKEEVTEEVVQAVAEAIVEEANEEQKEVEEVVNEIIEEANEEIVATEEVTEEVMNTVYPGIVSGCTKLNVRKEANTDAEVICVIDENAEVVVDENGSTDDFYKIVTAAGVEGFCMSKYITIK